VISLSVPVSADWAASVRRRRECERAVAAGQPCREPGPSATLYRMGPGSGAWSGGVGWIKRYAARLDECLNEAEALARGSYGNVSAVFAVLLGECGEQVVGDDCHLGMRVLCRKLR